MLCRWTRPQGTYPQQMAYSERPLQIEARKQVSHWQYDTVIGSHHKGAFVTIVERKSGYGVMAKVVKTTSISQLSHCG